MSSMAALRESFSGLCCLSNIPIAWGLYRAKYLTLMLSFVINHHILPDIRHKGRAVVLGHLAGDPE